MTLCGIVLYNPDLDRLKKNICSILYQVDKILLVDNHSENINDVLVLLDELKINIEIIKYEHNFGIAKALNKVLDYAYNNGFKYVLTMDQDSICDEKMVSCLKKYIGMENVGIICPFNIDDNDSNVIVDYEKVEEVDWCITSGSLILLEKCYPICRFDEKMFIDLVDYDFAYQVMKNNLRIIRVHSAILHHRLGELVVKRFFGKKLEITNHSPLRKYYYIRNSYYIIGKYSNDKIVKKMLKKRIKSVFIKTIIFENNKLKKIKMMIKGKKDSKRM